VGVFSSLLPKLHIHSFDQPAGTAARAFSIGENP